MQEEEEPRGLEKLKKILREMCTECKRDGKYIICFIGSGVIRLITVLFSNFLLLWITSFVDDGAITEKESKGLYQKIILISTVASMFLAPLFGFISDKLPSTVLIPIAFTLRGLCGYAFMMLNDPTDILSAAICCLLIIFTLLEAISVEVLFFRGMPS